MGAPLHADTITKITPWMQKDSLFNKYLIEARYENYNEWGNTKTTKYPRIYYDGYFKTKIQLDTNFTINQNAENFIKAFSNDMDGINWNIPKYSDSPDTEEGFKIKNFVDNKVACEIEITVYFKSAKTHLFTKYAIRDVYFQIKRGNDLLLIYSD